MSLYNCKGCSTEIPANKARVRCQTCLSYDLCANCFLVGTFSPPHQASHQTTLFKTSGLVPAPFPSQPPPQLTQHNANTTPFQSQIAGATASGWQIFFNPTDWSPTPSFLSLMQTLFSHLDPQQTSTLTPEAYASFLDAEGYPLNQNTWRNALTSAQPGTSREAQADLALKRAYDAFGIEHRTAQRPGSATQSRGYPFGGILSSFPSGSMPLLTLNGFVALTAMEVLFDPSKGHADLNRALKTLNIPLIHSWGEIPRWTLPATAPPQILQRASEAQRNANMQVGHMASVNTMGNVVAVNALSGTQPMMFYGTGRPGY